MGAGASSKANPKKVLETPPHWRQGAARGSKIQAYHKAEKRFMEAVVVDSLPQRLKIAFPGLGEKSDAWFDRASLRLRPPAEAVLETGSGVGPRPNTHSYWSKAALRDSFRNSMRDSFQSSLESSQQDSFKVSPLDEEAARAMLEAHDNLAAQNKLQHEQRQRNVDLECLSSALKSIKGPAAAQNKRPRAVSLDGCCANPTSEDCPRAPDESPRPRTVSFAPDESPRTPRQALQVR
ncbi:hypothetical protein M885DRAFT_618695 [Pelagophyceae sp. CCMP2097]|nr:hypothetical protein M885DRAFT_618695 [Pelagophyceae sp. CCMP2097]